MKFSERLVFLRGTVNDFRQTGSIAPSTRFLGRKLVNMAAIDQADVILEFGMGTGSVTRHIIQKKPIGSRLISFEINSLFVRKMQKRYASEGVEIVNLDARLAREVLDKKNLSYCDCVISSIPWSLLPQKVMTELLKTVVEVLHPERGVFVTYSYLHSFYLPKQSEFMNRLRDEFLTVDFSSVVWRNIPPAVCIVAKQMGK